jgi:methylenetetrahydrofolate reductase (NADPH)
LTFLLPFAHNAPMSFSKLYTDNRRVLSLEFFPPKQQVNVASALELMRGLSDYHPNYMTVTYHPGGGSRGRTREMVSYIHNRLGLPAVAHLTCVGHSKDEIDTILGELEQEGISMILALRGDPPKDQPDFVPHPDGFNNARDLISYISQRGGFSIAAAGYPETHRDAESPEGEIEYLKQKVAAGAEVVLTQLFFDRRYYFDFCERCEKAGIVVPIVPGVMPIANVSQLKRFTLMCGATIPSEIVGRLEKIQDDAAAVEQFGIDFAIELCSDLLAQGAPGLHLYTLNRPKQISALLEALSFQP